jgi:hypothetical protein
MSKLQRRGGLLITVVALAGAMALAASEPPTPDQAQAKPLAVNKPLAEEQLKLIDQGLAELDHLYRGGEVSITSPAFTLWTRRRVDALRAAGAGKAEIVGALEKYVARMKSCEGWMKDLHQKDQATLADITDARYQRLEAEIWLNQEKARETGR